jgi:hypothetical protein
MQGRLLLKFAAKIFLFSALHNTQKGDFSKRIKFSPFWGVCSVSVIFSANEKEKANEAKQSQIKEKNHYICTVFF